MLSDILRIAQPTGCETPVQKLLCTAKAVNPRFMKGNDSVKEAMGSADVVYNNNCSFHTNL